MVRYKEKRNDSRSSSLSEKKERETVPWNALPFLEQTQLCSKLILRQKWPQAKLHHSEKKRQTWLSNKSSRVWNFPVFFSKPWISGKTGKLEIIFTKKKKNAIIFFLIWFWKKSFRKNSKFSDSNWRIFLLHINIPGNFREWEIFSGREFPEIPGCKL